LGYKFGFILWIFVQRPIFNIWEPQRFEIANRVDADEINKKMFFYFNLLLIMFAFGISIFGRDLFRIISDKTFWDAYKIIPLIMIAYIIQAWTAFGNFGIMYHEKTKYIAVGTILASISSLIFCFILIPYFGSFGAAYATILAFYIRFAFIFKYSQKEYRLYLQWIKILIMMALAASLYAISVLVQQDSIVVSIIINMLIFISFPTLIFIFPLFKKEEKKK